MPDYCAAAEKPPVVAPGAGIPLQLQVVVPLKLPVTNPRTAAVLMS